MPSVKLVLVSAKAAMPPAPPAPPAEDDDVVPPTPAELLDDAAPPVPTDVVVVPEDVGVSSSSVQATTANNDNEAKRAIPRIPRWYPTPPERGDVGPRSGGTMDA
jgi:hypothetical protein